MSVARLRTLIVDDEPVARARMAVQCAGVEGLDIVGTASDGQEALATISALSPDLVLLDIAMPGLDGMAVAETIARMPDPPCIVFCTASDGDAISAFEVSAIDYLLKPISGARLARAAEKARLHRSVLTTPPVAKQQWIDHLWVPHRGAMLRVAVDDIDWIEAERDYVRLWTRNAHYLLRDTLTRIESLLDKEVFVRVRRSAIVRRRSILSLRHDGSGAWSASLKSGSKIRIGPTYLPDLKALLKAERMS